MRPFVKLLDDSFVISADSKMTCLNRQNLLLQIINMQTYSFWMDCNWQFHPQDYILQSLCEESTRCFSRTTKPFTIRFLRYAAQKFSSRFLNCNRRNGTDCRIHLHLQSRLRDAHRMVVRQVHRYLWQSKLRFKMVHLWDLWESWITFFFRFGGNSNGALFTSCCQVLLLIVLTNCLKSSAIWSSNGAVICSSSVLEAVDSSGFFDFSVFSFFSFIT